MAYRPAFPALAWRHGVCAARSSDGIIFLDIEADAYFCIYDPVDDPRAAISDAVRGQLVALGLATKDDELTESCLPIGLPQLWMEPQRGDHTPLRLRDLYRFGATFLGAAILFRLRPFRTLIEPPHPPIPALPHHGQRVATLVRHFDRLCLWLPFRIECLFRSFLLLRFLRSYGFTADWNFGASLFPFSAHCWLSAGDMLIGEHASRVDEFSILLVRRAAA